MTEYEVREIYEETYGPYDPVIGRGLAKRQTNTRLAKLHKENLKRLKKTK